MLSLVPPINKILGNTGKAANNSIIDYGEKCRITNRNLGVGKEARKFIFVDLTKFLFKIYPCKQRQACGWRDLLSYSMVHYILLRIISM